jgi:DNA polymerase-3 subunit delta'
MPSPDRATSIAWLKGQGIKDPENSLAAAGYAPLSALEQNDEDYLVEYQSFIRQVVTPGGLNPISLAE